VERLAATKAHAPARALLETAAQPPSAVMVWTPAQLGSILDAAEDDPLYTLSHLIAHRGLRRGESCGLAWTDVDLDAARLTVRQQIVQLGWDTYEDKPKSDASDREIALDSGTVAALRAHRRRQIPSRLQWGPGWVDSGKVFTREDGSALHPATVTDRFQTLAAAAKLPPIRLHDLRHGAASLMLAAGVAPKVVQETLGHSTITLTLTPTRACTPKSRPRPPRPQWHSFRAPALLHTHTAHTRLRAPRQDQEIPGQTVGRVGLEPTT
jgi:integrase